MKKLLACLVVAAFAVACSSSSDDDAVASLQAIDGGSPEGCEKPFPLRRDVCSEPCAVLERYQYFCRENEACSRVEGCFIEASTGDTYGSSCLPVVRLEGFRRCTDEERQVWAEARSAGD